MLLTAGMLASVLAAGPPLQVPWMCGVTKPCTQAHGGFSHDDNSYWAWDFDVNEGEEVWAASNGVVSYLRMDSTTGGCDESYGGDANHVVVDHDDGTAIIYLHLQANSSPLEVGDAVRPGMLIGRVGLTGYVCGDHLHTQVMEQCGGYYCQSLSAMFADYGDPQQGDQIESTNCPACTIELDGTTTLVSELEPGCFVRETTSWWSTMSGDDAHHFYTTATDGAEAVSTGTWTFGVAVPGDYRVEVFVPDQDANATGAVYEVRHEGGVQAFAVDQEASKGWIELGVFGFSGTEGESVWLGDNTGEAVGLDRRLGYDAVRLTFVPGADGEGSTGGVDTSGGDPTDPTGVTASSTTSASGTASATDATASGGGTDDPAGTGDEDALPDAFGEDEGGQGCGCLTGRGGPTQWLWLVIMLPAVRRRSFERRAGSIGERRAL